MPESKQHTPKPILRQIVGWVLVLPLLLSFARLPYPLGQCLGMGVIAASAFGVRLARRQASRRVTALAFIGTLLNVIALVGMGTASFIYVLYSMAWVHGYPYYANWVYWNF